MGKKVRGKISAGIRSFIPRQLETDADTRKAGRKEVEVLPASTAIVNIYQLVKKELRGGSAEKRRLGTQKTKKQQTGERRKEKEMIYPSKFLNGRYVDNNGNIVQLPGESNSDYEIANKKQRQMAEAAKQAEEEKRNDEAVKGRVAFVAEKARQTELGKKVVAQALATSPKAELIKRIINERIPYQDKVLNDGRYEGLSLGDEDDIRSIDKAIDRAKKDDLFAPGIFPKPIIAVGKNMNSPRSTTTVFVLRDLSKLRRKKIIHSKVKRPITHGNKKKRIVLKKKGGKR